MAETVRLRLLRELEAPSPDGSAVRFGLQDKTGALHDGIARADGVVQFDLELTVKAAPDGTPDFGGPFASGPRGERFVYLSWQRTDGAGFMNRIKVRLKDIGWEDLRTAQVMGQRLEADLRGVSTGGGTRPVSWRTATG
jgi:hypothetical protein